MKRRWLLALVLFLSACRSQTTPTPTSTLEIHPELKNIPVYPESTAWMDGIPGVDVPERYQIYSYVADVYNSDTLVKYYEENLPSYGWELFDKTEDEIGNIKGTTLLFSKGKTIAQLEVMEWTVTSKLVSVNFYTSP